MIALLQRVSKASVVVDQGDAGTRECGSIGAGILAFVAVEKGYT
jgi:D-Tyr-tRNAtyr deacylase